MENNSDRKRRTCKEALRIREMTLQKKLTNEMLPFCLRFKKKYWETFLSKTKRFFSYSFPSKNLPNKRVNEKKLKLRTKSFSIIQNVWHFFYIFLFSFFFGKINLKTKQKKVMYENQINTFFFYYGKKNCVTLFNCITFLGIFWGWK